MAGGQQRVDQAEVVVRREGSRERAHEGAGKPARRGQCTAAAPVGETGESGEDVGGRSGDGRRRRREGPCAQNRYGQEPLSPQCIHAGAEHVGYVGPWAACRSRRPAREPQRHRPRRTRNQFPPGHASLPPPAPRDTSEPARPTRGTSEARRTNAAPVRRTMAESRLTARRASARIGPHTAPVGCGSPRGTSPGTPARSPPPRGSRW